MESGRFSEARVLLESELQRQNESARLWELLGAIRAELRDWSAAREAFDRALALSPDNENLLASLGFTLARLGEFDEAIATLEKAVTLGPDRASTRFLLGRVQFAAGHFQEATSNFEKAILQNPENESFYLDYVAILSDGRLYQEAEKILRYALRHLPKSARLHYALGVSCQIQVKRKEAQKEFRRVIELDPSFPGIYVALASSLVESGDLPGAELVFQTALKRDKRDFDAHYFYGILLNKMGRQVEAIDRFRQCLGLNAENGPAHYYLGKSLAEAGQIELAEKELKAAIRLKPDIEEAHLVLGRVYTRLGKEDDARQAYANYETVRQEKERKKESLRVLLPRPNWN